MTVSNPEREAIPSTAPDWVTICPIEDIYEFSAVNALIEGEQVAIFRLPGQSSDAPQLFAVNNLDPFSKAHVMSRGIVGDKQGVPVVASPLYKQHFRLDNGLCVEDATMSLGSYPVRLVAGMVQVMPSPRTADVAIDNTEAEG